MPNNTASVIKTRTCDEWIPLLNIVQSVYLPRISNLVCWNSRNSSHHARLVWLPTHWSSIFLCLNSLSIIKLRIFLADLCWLKTLFSGDWGNTLLVIIFFNFRNGKLGCRIYGIRLLIKILNSTGGPCLPLGSCLLIQCREGIGLGRRWPYPRYIHNMLHLAFRYWIVFLDVWI